MVDNKSFSRIVQVIFRNPASGTSEYTNCLIDTGADISILPQSLTDRLGLWPEGFLTISTVTNHMQVPLVSVVVQVDGQNFTIRPAVIQHIEQPVLGWDIIKQGFRHPVFINLVVGDVLHILDAIPSLKNNTVLVLGQDTSEIGRLRSIQAKLSELAYNGIVVKDIVDIDIQSVEEKVNMLASLSRFVICENSVASGHIDELKICATNRFVTAILQQEGMGATWMQADYPLDFSFMKTFSYSTRTRINAAVEKAVEWAEKKLNERKSFFNHMYSWR
jgi:hypothetical protein